MSIAKMADQQAGSSASTERHPGIVEFEEKCSVKCKFAGFGLPVELRYCRPCTDGIVRYMRDPEELNDPIRMLQYSITGCDTCKEGNVEIIRNMMKR